MRFDLAQTRSRSICTWGHLERRNRMWRRVVDLRSRQLGTTEAASRTDAGGGAAASSSSPQQPRPLPWLDPLTAAEMSELLDLEDEMSVDEILTCRLRAGGKLAWQQATLARGAPRTCTPCTCAGVPPLTCITCVCVARAGETCGAHRRAAAAEAQAQA